MRALPDDAQPLEAPGYFVWTYYSPNYLYWYFLGPQEGGDNWYHEYQAVTVRFPWDSSRFTRPQDLLVTANTSSFGSLDDRMLSAYSEVLFLASEFIRQTQGDFNEKLEELKAIQAEREAARLLEQKARQEERERYLESERQKRIELQARREYLFEMLKWQLEEKIKLTRDGYRAVVFGTIKSVNEHSMDIVTEKNKHMRIVLSSINKMWIKHGDEKRYGVIYRAGEEPKKKEVSTND